MNDFRIEEDGLHTKLIYHFSKDEEIDTYSFRMIEAAAPDWIVSLAPHDGAKDGASVGFDITDMTSVSLLASEGAEINFIADIFEQIVYAACESEKYLFDSSMFVLDGEHLYYHGDSGKTKLLLLPRKDIICEQSFKNRLRELFKDILYDFRYFNKDDGISLIKLLNYINNERDFTMRGFTEILKDIRSSENILYDNMIREAPVYNSDDSEHSDNPADKKSHASNKLRKLFGTIFNYDNSKDEGMELRDNMVTDIGHQDIVCENRNRFGDTKEMDMSALDALPYLLRKKDGNRIFINKPVFNIGKEERYADYRITDNAAISRMHAEIRCDAGVYTVIDQDSKNHTYVNGSVAGAYIPVEIYSGDTVSFADDEHVFYV